MGILVAFFAVQHLGTDKIGYTFAPVVVVWLLLISGIGIYDLIKYDIGTLRAFNPKYIIDYFRRNKKKGWVSLGEILLCFTGRPISWDKTVSMEFLMTVYIIEIAFTIRLHHLLNLSELLSCNRHRSLIC